MSRLVTTVCVALSMFAIAGAAFATSYPGYTCYTLPGCNFANQISGEEGLEPPAERDRDRRHHRRAD